ncbi:MAG: DNA repair protein RecN [Spirochaetaceae bacterium]|jgi:DNA repair protein RecN (Recombination protein N)|nr:DNA repair protein RecN [Spirochaetaceae bacterium]
MLEELSVRNYALIDNLNLPLEGGLNVISGETGAGKSIIIGSLSFLLGGKTGIDCIRTGADEVSVSALISIKQEDSDAQLWLSAHEIQIDEGRILVRRNLKSNGRSSLYIQDVPVSRTEAAEFTALLIDIHGQHEHESLLRRETHRKYLDRFAGIEAEVNAFTVVFQQLTDKYKTLDNAARNEKEKEARIEFLSFSVDEINTAELKPGESRALEAEASRLSSYEKLTAFAQSASASLFDDEASVLSLSRKAKNALDNAAALDSSLFALSQRIDALYFEAEDISGEMRAYRGKLSYEPARLEEIEERCALIYRLKKKYLAKGAESLQGKSVEELILEHKAQAEAEITDLLASEENRAKLQEEIAGLEKDIARRAKDITAQRSLAANELSKRISEILSHLGMADAVFSVRLEAKEREGQRASILCGPYGADDIEFLISANKGEPLKELARIASGGELSRVMLAIKTALSLDRGGDKEAKDNSPDTLVFDEIDTGIGGEVALAVGEYLSKIGRQKQIFCITHLASIACRADHHLLVEKKTDAERTLSLVRNLSRDQRRGEIARMLSGEQGETALRHADELLTKYGH